MVGHIQHLKIVKDAWETLERMYSTNTKARKLQLKNELNTIKKSSSQSIDEYTLKIKELRDVLASIGTIVEDEDFVCCTLNGLREDER